MTRIEYDRDDRCLKITGHADGGPYGEDVICAAISALEQTLLRMLLDMEAAGDGRTIHSHATPGEAMIRFIPKPWVRVRSLQYFEFVMTGLRMIAERYPQNVRIEEEK